MDQADVDIQGCDGIQPLDSFETADFPGVCSEPLDTAFSWNSPNTNYKKRYYCFWASSTSQSEMVLSLLAQARRPLAENSTAAILARCC